MRTVYNTTDRVTEWSITADATLLGTTDSGEHIWRVELSDTTNVLTIAEYTMGSAYGQTVPPVDWVFDSLRSDASGVADGETFEEWANDMGYDIDSRTDEPTYNAAKTQTEALRAFLGEDRFRVLIDDTEGL